MQLFPLDLWALQLIYFYFYLCLRHNCIFLVDAVSIISACWALHLYEGQSHVRCVSLMLVCLQELCNPIRGHSPTPWQRLLGHLLKIRNSCPAWEVHMYHHHLSHTGYLFIPTEKNTGKSLPSVWGFLLGFVSASDIIGWHNKIGDSTFRAALIIYICVCIYVRIHCS